MKRCLICVDLQNDFTPGGSLAVKDGDKIIPIINNLLKEFNLVIFTQDWHPVDMNAFASQHEGMKPFEKYFDLDGKEDTLWPDHCVQDTVGALLDENIMFSNINGDFYFFKKGDNKDYHPYSGFEGTNLAEFLREKGVEQVFVCGLATDFCVADTAIDSAMEGFETVVILDATKPINEDLSQTLINFNEANVKVIESWELNMYNLL